MFVQFSNCITDKLNLKLKLIALYSRNHTIGLISARDICDYQNQDIFS